RSRSPGSTGSVFSPEITAVRTPESRVRSASPASTFTSIEQPFHSVNSRHFVYDFWCYGCRSGGSAGTSLHIVIGEGEHGGIWLQLGGGASEAVSHGALPVARVGAGYPYPLEAAFLKPRADLRHQVGLPAGSGPHHGATGRTQLRAIADRPLDAVVGHVAEQPAGKHEVGRHQVGVRAGDRGVAFDDL